MQYELMDWKGQKHTYTVEYQELRESHLRICRMDNDEFMASLPEATHLAVIIAWFKGMPAHNVLGDCGIIHELVHLMHIPSEPTVCLPDIREQYAEQLKLA